MLFRLEDGGIRPIATLGVPEALLGVLQGRVACAKRRCANYAGRQTRQPVHVVDLPTEPAYIARKSAGGSLRRNLRRSNTPRSSDA